MISSNLTESKKCPRCGREMPTRTAHERRKKYCSIQCARRGPKPKTIEQLKNGRKKCTCCKTIKNLTEFPFRGYYENGMEIYGSHCKYCRVEYQKSYHFRNRDTCIYKMMLYQGKNPEKISKRRKKHYRENRDEILENKSKQYHENPEPKRKYNKQYYRTHKKEINAYSRLYGKEHRRELTKKHNLYIHDRRKSDPKFNIKRSMCRLVNHVIHGKRKQSLEKYLGYSIQTLLHHFDNGEFKVRDYLKGGYCIDHIIPKSLYEKDEIRLSFSYENLQIIPAKENIAKGNKLDWELVKKYDLYHLLPKKIKIQAESENRSDMVA